MMLFLAMFCYVLYGGVSYCVLCIVLCCVVLCCVVLCCVVCYIAVTRSSMPISPILCHSSFSATH